MKPRPRSTGIPIALKYDALTLSIETIGFRAFGSVRPSIVSSSAGTTDHREVARGRDCLQCPDAAQSLAQAACEIVALLGRRILPIVQVDLKGQETLSFEAEVEGIEHEEAPHHEPGAREQHQRERDLHHEQTVRPAIRPDPTRPGTPPFFQHFVEARLRHVQRGSEPEDDARCRGTH